MMKKASYIDLENGFSFLSNTFKADKSVRNIAGTDKLRERFSMLYSFGWCMKRGEG